MKMRLPLFLMCAAVSVGGFAVVNDGAGKYMPANGYQKAVALDNPAELRVPNMKVNKASLEHKILKSETLKDGSVINYVESGNSVSKVLKAKGRNLVSPLSSTIQKVVESEDGATMVESFEGWDGETEDWIPSGWTDQLVEGSAEDILIGGNVTWMVQEPMFDYPTDGDYVAHIQFSYSAQASTLISAPITPVAGQFLMVDINYSPGWYMLDQLNMGESYVFDQQNSNLVVSVSADNGATWTPVFDVLKDDATKYSYSQLLDDISSYSHPWTTAIIDLSAYSGKQIQVAFAYSNTGMGESAKIDNLRIGYPVAVAGYSRPEGSFLFGLSEDFMSQASSEILTTPYVDVTWRNFSEGVKSNEWEYIDVENSTSSEIAYLYSDERNLTVNYEPVSMDVPTLMYETYKGETFEYYPAYETQTNTGETVMAPYTVTYGGGTTKNFLTEDGSSTVSMTMGAGNYDLEKKYTAIITNEAGTEFLFGTGGDATWQNALEDPTARVAGVANVFDKPATPYVFTTLWINGEFAGSPDATFTLNIYEYTEDGRLNAEPIETSTATMKDVNTAAPGYCSLPFVFKEQVGSLTREKEVEIDSKIMVVVTFDEKVTTFCPFMQSGPNEDGSCYSYAVISTTEENEETGETVESTSFYPSNVFQISTGPLNSAFLFNMDATFTWFHSEDNEFPAPVSGGEKSFTVESYYASSAWTVEGDAVVGNSDNAWIDWAAEDVLIEEAGQQYYTGETTLVLTADPLPAGVTGRSAEVTVSIPGASKTFYVQQGEAGVEAVETSANRVSVVNGNFEVEAATATAVDVYNVAGQKVASAAIEGATTIPAQDLAKGMYILKFNDNTAVKVMK